MIVRTRPSTWPSLRYASRSRTGPAATRWPGRRAVRPARPALARLRRSARRGAALPGARPLACLLASLLAWPGVTPSAAPALRTANGPSLALEASYHNPPAPGETIVAARDTVYCDSERGARFTARSGFLAIDCRQAARGGRWRVVACRHVELADGGLWLVEVRAMEGRDEAGVPGWIPLPWHDWA